MIGNDVIGLYKYVAGLNAIRLRHGLSFASRSTSRPPKAPGEAIPGLRSVSDRRTADLQGQDVKLVRGAKRHLRRDRRLRDGQGELKEAIEIIGGAAGLPEHLRPISSRRLVFHGPPGTGKTLSPRPRRASLAATIMVMSGPRSRTNTSARATQDPRPVRRGAPERAQRGGVRRVRLDRGAAQRTGRRRVRAGNAIVAQLLTELDGFRPRSRCSSSGPRTGSTSSMMPCCGRAGSGRSRSDCPSSTPAARSPRSCGAFRGRGQRRTARPDRAATEQFSGDDIRSLFRDARAGELVGEQCPADAYRIGELVGELGGPGSRETGTGGVTPARRDGRRPAAAAPRPVLRPGQAPSSTASPPPRPAPAAADGYPGEGRIVTDPAEPPRACARMPARSPAGWRISPRSSSAGTRWCGCSGWPPSAASTSCSSGRQARPRPRSSACSAGCSTLRYFSYLLTRFTEPAELFGPMDVELFTARSIFRSTPTGMLPEAHLAFLDEVFQGSSAILNTLLTLINERTFHNGPE